MYILSSPRMIAVSKLRWYSTDDILEYIYELREDLKVGRLTPTQCIDNISTTAPFSTDQRFPESKTYICEGIGAWNNRLQQIQFHVSIISHPRRLGRYHPVFQSIGDVESLLLQVIDECLQGYETAEDFIDRQGFEERYGLKWNEAEQEKDLTE